MIKVKVLHMLVLLVSLLPGVALASSWVCISDGAAGFQLAGNSGVWQGTGFTTGSKYVIRPWREGDEVVTNHAGTAPKYIVVVPDSDVDPLGFFFTELDPLAENVVGASSDMGRVDFQFSPVTNRFVVTVFSEFLFREDFKGLPFVEIGRCTKLD